MRRYHISEGRIRTLDAFESYIFEYNDESILRLSHSLRRTEALIQAEVEWMDHLARSGVSVAGPIRSANGRLVEPIDDDHGGYFLATAFRKASGASPRGQAWTDENTHTYGRLLGSLHQATMAYEPTSEARRPTWEEDSLGIVERFLPTSEEVVLRRYRELCDRLTRLPTDPSVFGLIHQDAHMGNFFIDDAGVITLFDFDDCVYSWFANDLAIVLFYQVVNQPDAIEKARRFLPPFMDGYREVRSFDSCWFDTFADFLKLRELELHAIMHRDLDVTAIPHPWCAAFMAGRRERIEADAPVLDIDFRSIV